ncbi:AraC family transcriptional regulator [Aquimarina sp. AD10]|uniref:helix-turn-helix domain-containing protein n=1 Tax=Aquimarina sp. AD10 TaxID=1714849 RepID=UPI000E4C3CFA|nr:helix-turn-helix domain-containing protein [Aquimarina sp. AD10]AXT59352.1 AraC family transcriptional regulator [Aquimarina sp. AD10]RKM91896.1 helix-turn-helix domain-containing protein [Aquimarina sp. AD10]
MHRALIHLFIIKLILLPFTTNAQSFTDVLQNKNYDELEKLFLKYEEIDSIKARKIISLYLDKAKFEQDTFKIARAYYHFYNVAKDHSKLSYTDSIINLTKHKQNKDFPARAYFRKAQFFLFEKRNIKKTLEHLNKAQKLAEKNQNTRLLYRIDYYLGIVRSEHLGEKQKAVEIFKKCANFYKSTPENNYPIRYLYTLHAIAETYIGLKQNDSATHYNTIGYQRASKSNDLNQLEMKTYFTLCEGINQYEQNRYLSAIDSITRALPKILEFKDKSNTIDSYFYLGKSYYELKNNEKSIYYLKKTDSILETLKSIPQYKHIKTYEYLKEYFKETGDLNNQNKYLDKLNSVLNNYLNDQIFISKKIKEDYDIPLLLEEKELLIKKLNQNNNAYIKGIFILGILLFLCAGLLYYQYKKKQRYRIRFENLISEGNKSSSQNKTITEAKTVVKNKELKVPEKHVTYILEKLVEFENEQGYLTVGLSAQSLADNMETNVKYLSLIINHYKNKSFTSYLNQLRIDYAVKELQENTMLRKFTIKAIANEFGYSTAETFSNAFYKQVKIKPSYYIKELSKVK